MNNLDQGDSGAETEIQLFRLQSQIIQCGQLKRTYLHVFSDITKIQKREELKAQGRYNRLMLANVSHEFKTPLNAIMCSNELILIEIQNLR